MKLWQNVSQGPCLPLPAAHTSRNMLPSVPSCSCFCCSRRCQRLSPLPLDVATGFHLLSNFVLRALQTKCSLQDKTRPVPCCPRLFPNPSPCIGLMLSPSLAHQAWKPPGLCTHSSCLGHFFLVVCLKNYSLCGIPHSTPLQMQSTPLHLRCTLGITQVTLRSVVHLCVCLTGL